MIPAVVIVDQSAIVESDECQSLFFHGMHILDGDASSMVNVMAVAEKLARPSGSDVITIPLKPRQLAAYISELRREQDRFVEADSQGGPYTPWIQGYDEGDVWRACIHAGLLSEREVLADRIVLDEPMGMETPSVSSSDVTARGYRLRITADNGAAGKLSFELYPARLDVLGDDVPKIGLAGEIELDEGKPAISLGLAPDQLRLHIVSDEVAKLSVRADCEAGDTSDSRSVVNHSYKLYPRTWISEARKQVAERFLQSQDWGKKVVVPEASWLEEGANTYYSSPNVFNRRLSITCQESGETLSAVFTVTFEGDSLWIQEQSLTYRPANQSWIPGELLPAGR